MRGGMTMVGDLFNHGLKATVSNLCGELSDALANNQIFQPVPKGSSGGNNWWPGDFGVPSSSGSQNDIRYAFFPQARRLVVQRNGQISVFDTLDHQIGGVSQQQGGGSSLTFTSQYGTISTLSLPLVTGEGLQSSSSPTTPTNFAAPSPPPVPSWASAANQQNSPQGSLHLMTLLEKLGQLRDAGVLTDAEFATKKTELLGRL